ncbi:MAG TPA: shikimate kinase [Chthonomonadaceae bacterium]|nr:shikimate kinase [Chthonomonadaceae bacterium]
MGNLILIGFMGAGKSTVGKLCAAHLGYAFVDSDAVIEAHAGCSVAQLFAARGERAFRRLERQALAALSARPGVVIATGGGAVLDADNVALLRARGRVVLLLASPEAVLARVGEAATRPLLAGALDPRSRIAALLAERDAAYRRAAHHCVDTLQRTPEQVAEDVVTWYRKESE